MRRLSGGALGPNQTRQRWGLRCGCEPSWTEVPTCWRGGRRWALAASRCSAWTWECCDPVWVVDGVGWAARPCENAVHHERLVGGTHRPALLQRHRSWGPVDERIPLHVLL
ncbi:hypothetical protein NDU88_006006 [Pleurodeles waltl]|uniref:Uncharacterized protein n=1 Tax=Pleurodeles waltl TaxID=8319 RepID=A0AAV7UKM6_PLEWA|nr:hypothetical protein NDU88_006006 [Pleurodeles waltl]